MYLDQKAGEGGEVIFYFYRHIMHKFKMTKMKGTTYGYFITFHVVEFRVKLQREQNRRLRRQYILEPIDEIFIFKEFRSTEIPKSTRNKLLGKKNKCIAPVTELCVRREVCYCDHRDSKTPYNMFMLANFKPLKSVNAK